MPSQSKYLSVTPTLSGSAYNAWQVMGGLLELPYAVIFPPRSCVLQNITMQLTGGFNPVEFYVALLNDEITYNNGDNFSLSASHYTRYAGFVSIPSADWKTHNSTASITVRNLGLVWQNSKNPGIGNVKNASLFALLLPAAATPAYTNGCLHLQFGVLLDT